MRSFVAPLSFAAFLLMLLVSSMAATTHGPAAAQACLSPGTWYSFADSSATPVTAQVVLSDMARREVVLLGEQHDNADHHRWQLQTLAALHMLRPQMIIGFESFPRRVQPVLDQWIAGQLTARQFLERSEWEKVWSFPAELYMPLFEFARLNRIPIVALNVDRTLTAAIRKQGWDAVPLERREGISRPASASEVYESYLFEVYRQHSPPNKQSAMSRSDAAFRYFVQSQTTWDRAMAEALASRIKTEGGTSPLVVGIMGAGHVRNGYGVPHQLRDLGVKSIGTLIPADTQASCSELKAGYADAVFAVPGGTATAEAPPPRLGVQLEVADGNVRVVAVTSGSLAELTGVKAGDRIVSVAGSPVVTVSTVIAAVRAALPGTWLPLQVRRGDNHIDLIVKFPPKS
jgi:uncharacterized iron-regulated protein